MRKRYISFLLTLVISFFSIGKTFGQAAIVSDPGQTGINSAILSVNTAIKAAQASQFAKTIQDAIALYKATTSVYQTGVQIYNTGVAAVDMAKRAAGDVKGMTDLQSYQLMFSRLHQQEVQRINAAAVPLINFNQLYSSKVRKYISPEGALNLVQLAKDYSTDPNIGYSKLLVEMTNMNREYWSYSCQSFETEAISFENQALLYEKEAQYVSNFIAYSNMGISMDNLNKNAATIDRVALGDKDGPLGNAAKGLSDNVNYLSQSLIKNEMDKYSKANNGKEVTPMTTDQMLVRFMELQQSALKLRELAANKRSLIWEYCGPKVLMDDLGRKAYQQTLLQPSTSRY